MMMFCTACKLKWAVLLVKGVKPHVHRANQVQCQPYACEHVAVRKESDVGIVDEHRVPLP